MATSLTQIIASSEDPSVKSFLAVQSNCSNQAYFTTDRPIERMSSWEGYYYAFDVKLDKTSIGAGGGTINVTYTTQRAARSGKTPTITTTLGTVSNITATDSTGKGTAVITVPSRATTSGDARTGTITVTCDGATGTATFTQAHNNPTTLTQFTVDSVAPTSKSVTAASGSFTLSWRQLKRTQYTWPSGSPATYSDWVVEANAGISSVTSNQTWVTVGTKTNSDADGYNSITISYGANQSSSSRSATITITNGSNASVAIDPKTCGISQAAHTISSVAIKSVSVYGGTLTNPATYAAAGASKTVASNAAPSCTVTLTLTYNSGYTTDTTSYSSYGALSGPTYSWSVVSGAATLTSSNAASLSVSMPNNTTTSTRSSVVRRTSSYTFTLSSTYGGANKTGTGTADATCSQSAGSVEYIITPSVTAMGTLAAAGQSKTSTITYTTKWNGVTTATGTALSGYTITESTDSLGIVSASGTTGTVTVTSSNNKSTSSGTFTYTISKSGYTSATISGSVAKGSYSCSITAYGTPTISIGSGITAAGGSSTITASVSNTQTCYWNGVVESTSSVAGSVNLSIQSQYFSTSSSATSGTAITRYSLSGTTLSHSTMAKNVGYDYCIVKAVNAGDSSKTKTATNKVQNSVGAYYVTTYGTPVVSVSSNALTAAGGSIVFTATVTNNTRRDYTSGSYDTSTTTGSIGEHTISTQFFTTSSTATSGSTLSRFSNSGWTVSHTTMGANAGYDVVRYFARNAGDTSKVGYSDYIRVQNAVTGTTTSYGSWSYNWTTTGSSTRTRTVTYTDTYTSGSTANRAGTAQTETGGGRYIVLDSFSDGKSEGSVHEFSAAGGSITARTVSHDYWPDSSGTHIQTVVITGVTTTCNGFTCSTSGSTVTITAASKSTTESAANTATITSTKTGWVTRSYGSCKQAENKITSVSLSASVSSGTLTAVSAAGGTVTWTPTVKYSSGSTSSDTSKFTPTYSVANYTTLTGFATKSYSASTGNYNYQQIGGSYSVASGEKFLCTLGSASVTAGSPAGYAILAYDLSESQNRGGVQLSNSKLADVITTNAADTLEFILYAGINGATAGVAVTYNNLCISRMNTAGSGATQSGNKTTWASLGTTIGGRNAAVTVSVKSTYTTTAVTATAYTAQAYNAITKIQAAVANTNTSSCHWYVSPGTSSNKIAAAGGTGTVVTNGTCIVTFTSGSTENKGSGAYNGNTITFSRTYKISGTTATTSNGFTLNTSTGAVTADNNKTTSERTVNITSDLTVTWGSLSNTLSQSRNVYQAAGSKVYGDPTITFSYATFAAAGATKTPTFSYSQVWTWNGVSGSGGTVTTGATDIVYGMTAKTGFTLNSTSTGSITAANNTTTSARSTTASVSFKLNGKTGSKTATVSQTAGSKVYGTPVITGYTYATFAYAGATKTPTVSYSQTWTWNGVSGSGGTETSGGTLTFSMTTSNGFTLGSTSTGSMTAAAQTANTNGANIVSRKPSTMPKVTVTLHGKTSSAYSCTACQQNGVWYRVKSISSSSSSVVATDTISGESGSDLAYVKMERIEGLTNSGTWSDVPYSEANNWTAAPFQVYFNYSGTISDSTKISFNTSSISRISGSGSTTAQWKVSYSFSSNTNSSTIRGTVCALHDNVKYITVTQSVATPKMLLFSYGRNQNGTDVYVDYNINVEIVYGQGPVYTKTTNWYLNYSTLPGYASSHNLFGAPGSIDRVLNVPPDSVKLTITGSVSNSLTSSSYNGSSVRLMFIRKNNDGTITNIGSTSSQDVSSNYNGGAVSGKVVQFTGLDYNMDFSAGNVEMHLYWDFGNW